MRLTAANALDLIGGYDIIADGSDNPGGGAAVDSTFVLRALLERGISGAALGMIWDPESVARATAAGVGVLVAEDDIPVRPEVRGASELLGIDPMYVACEGRLVAVVDSASTDTALAAMRAHPLGRDAAVIGRVTAQPVTISPTPITMAGAVTSLRSTHVSLLGSAARLT